VMERMLAGVVACSRRGDAHATEPDRPGTGLLRGGRGGPRAPRAAVPSGGAALEQAPHRPPPQGGRGPVRRARPGAAGHGGARHRGDVPGALHRDGLSPRGARAALLRPAEAVQWGVDLGPRAAARELAPALLLDLEVDLLAEHGDVPRRLDAD